MGTLDREGKDRGQFDAKFREHTRCGMVEKFCTEMSRYFASNPVNQLGNPGKPTVASLLEQACLRLKEKGVDQPQANAEFLLAHFLKKNRSLLRLEGDSVLEEGAACRILEAVEARAAGEPLSYILGEQDFMGFVLKVNPHVFIPRPETELLVEMVLRLVRHGSPLTVVDVGTGSGCIAIALAKFLPQAEVYAVDLSEAALEVARANARAHSVSERICFLNADLLGSQDPERLKADLIVSNPPYISGRKIPHLPPDVRKEPVCALSGGEKGLEVIERLVPQARRHLKPGGWLALEIDEDQGAPVMELMRRERFSSIQILQDGAGLDRIAMAQKIHG